MKLLSSVSKVGKMTAMVARTSSFICLSSFLLTVELPELGLVASLLELSKSSSFPYEKLLYLIIF